MYFTEDYKSSRNLNEIIKKHPAKTRKKAKNIYDKFCECINSLYTIKSKHAACICIKSIYIYHMNWVDHSIPDKQVRSHLKTTMRSIKNGFLRAHGMIPK